MNDPYEMALRATVMPALENAMDAIHVRDPAMPFLCEAADAIDGLLSPTQESAERTGAMIATDRQLELAQAYLHEIRHAIQAGERYGTRKDEEALEAAIDEIQRLRDDRG